MFSESSLAYLGSMAAAVQPVELSKNILQHLFHNLTPQTVSCVKDSTLNVPRASWRCELVQEGLVGVLLLQLLTLGVEGVERVLFCMIELGVWSDNVGKHDTGEDGH